jgi:hypothetical protein
MPPADGGLGPLRGREPGQLGDPGCGGEVHQAQLGLGVALGQGQQAAQGHGFTEQWIQGPAQPQGLDPLRTNALG